MVVVKSVYWFFPQVHEYGNLLVNCRMLLNLFENHYHVQLSILEFPWKSYNICLNCGGSLKFH
jgi:hypothetical protein